jgi:Family of unknown function (DUF6338)
MREATYVIRDAVTPFERLLLSLVYSALIYGVIIVVAVAGGLNDHDVAALYHGKRDLAEYLGLGIVALLVLPLLISESGRWWRRSKRLRPRLLALLRISSSHNTRSGWDHFFGGNAAALVRITLDDHRVIAGYFGEASLAGYTEDTQDLFLERRWELDDDGWFLRPAPSSLGIWVAHEHMVSLEVYDPGTPLEPWTAGPHGGTAS